MKGIIFVIRYYRISISCENRYLQDILGFENPDSHGLLAMCRPKFLHQDTKTILKNDHVLIFTVQI